MSKMTDSEQRSNRATNDEPRNPGRRTLLAGAAVTVGALATTMVPSAAQAAERQEGMVRPGRAQVTEKPISPLDAEFRWDSRAGADNTAAVQAAIDKAMRTPGGEVSLPAGEIRVRGLKVDYRGFPVQPVNGLPYGYAGPKIVGAGMRQTKIVQIEGATEDIFTVSGQVGDAAGPANNNKATGVTLADFEMTGTPTGGHGLYLRSLVNCEFRNLWIQRTGKSGIFRERATFVSGVDDEYSYANSWNKIKIVSPGGWGVEDSGLASIGGSMTNVEAISPGKGGFLLAPTNMTLLDCQAIGGSVGLRSVRNQNRSSINSGLTLLNFRSEGSRDGYEVLIEAGTSHMIVNPNFFPTSGAHCLGVGMTEQGPDFYVKNLTVVGGFFGLSADRFPNQKAIMLGSDSRGSRFVHPTIERWGNTRDEAEFIVDNGYRSSFELPGAVTEAPAGFTTVSRAPASIPVPAAGSVNEGWERSGDVWQKVAVFSDGRRVVIAS
ncbi:hypothetical protein ACFXP7_03515 [Microbacterium sp. P06]|uniref:hypothetical protein n=1 Tax=Microbacterium sp. P06 TaxID=3366949 RepID=UPI003746A6B3